MQPFTLALWLVPACLEAGLLWRASRSKTLSRFPLFYSYVAFLFLSSCITFGVFILRPQSYASVYWFRFLVQLVVEFAVLVEVSDQIFRPYGAIRSLGRGLTIGVGLILLSSNILPTFFDHGAFDSVLLDLAGKTCLAKCILIVTLLGVARYYRLPLNRNVGGILLGFSLYLAPGVAVHTAALYFGKSLYSGVFRIALPFAYNLALLVWTITLWRYQPAEAVASGTPKSHERTAESLSFHLVRFNLALSRLFRR